MTCINLLPRTRVAQLRRRRAARRWASGLGGYCVVALFGVWAFWIVGSGPRTAGARVLELQSTATTLQGQIDGLQGELQSVARQLRALRQIESHPDLGAMLRLLAYHAQGEVVLDSCALSPAAAAKSPAVAKSATSKRASGTGEVEGAAYDVELRGLSRSASAAGAYLLRLERSGVFEKISLVQSDQVRVEGADLVRFVLRGRLGPASGAGGAP
jgi:hypothetical protein